MALSFKEKRALQKTVKLKLEELKNGNLDFKAKRAAQKELKAAFAKLKVVVKGGADNQKLQDLIAGKYNDETPEKFLAILKEIVNELDGDIEPVKPPVISYLSLQAGSQG